jgi:hypothetical protein
MRSSLKTIDRQTEERTDTRPPRASVGLGKPETVGGPKGAVAPTHPATGVRLKTIALPTEHGGWGLSLEPILLGLLIAPTPSGAFLAVATMGAFLARHPFKIVAGDRRRGRRFPRTPVAERFVLLYGAIAAAGLFAAIKTAHAYDFLLPLALAAPLAAIQLAYDALGKSRSLLPELAGATGLASVATAIALAGGWTVAPAYGLWVVLAARVIPTILYVRARLTRLHGQTAKSAPIHLSHAMAAASVALLAWAGVVPALAAVALLLLVGRALYGLSGRDEEATAKRLGLRELGFGAATVLAVWVGHLTGW